MTLNFRVEKASSSNDWSQSVLSLGLAAFSLNLAVPVFASDFAHAQKVYVPSSVYDRRIDFNSIREQYTLPANNKNTTSSAKSSTDKKSSISSKSASTKNESNKSTTKTAGSKTALHYGSKQGSKTPFKTVTATTTPAQALNGKIARGSSFSEIARTLSAKIPASAISKMKATAVELEKSGKLDEAQRVFTKITQLTPSDKAAFHEVASIAVQRAKGYLKSNNFQDALLAARQALAASPSDPEANHVLSELYKKVGADPNDVASRLQTASSLYGQARYQEAEVEYKASLAIKPTPEAHIGLGKVAEKLHGPGQGKQHFEHALELDSNSASAHRELGLLHLNSGDLVAANSELSRAVILSPHDKEAGQNLIKLWQGQVSKLPNANSHLGLARAYQLNGDLNSAQAEYREVVRIDPNHPYLPAARQSFKIALAKQEAEKAMTAAKTLESQGLINDAYLKMNDAIAYSPGNTAYKLYQGELLEKLGQAEQAKQVYLTVLKDDPQNLTAVQKIKKLGNIAAGLSAAGLAQGLLPGGTGAIARHPDGFPGTKFPIDMTADSTALGGMNGAVAGIDQVGTLSSFMGQLRNHMLTAKETNQKAEDAAHKVIKQLTDPDAGAPPAAGAAASDDDIIKKILASPSPKGDSAAASSTEGGGVASALASAAAALASVKGGAPKPSTLAPSGETNRKAISPKATTAKAGNKSTTQRVEELEKQNKQLQDQLKHLSSNSNTNPVAPSMGGAPMMMGSTPSMGGTPIMMGSTPSMGGTPIMMGSATPMSDAPMGTNALSGPASAGFASPNSSSEFVPSFNTGGLATQMPIMQQLPSTQSSNSFASGIQQTPITDVSRQLPYSQTQVAPRGLDLNNTNSALPLQSSSDLRGPITNSSQAIAFELRQIKPTLKDVHLKVSLRNSTDGPLEISDNLQAVIKYNNQTESELKFTFSSKTIAPHGTVDGIVKVPFSKVDPTADLVLRNILPGKEELHINKTALSQK